MLARRRADKVVTGTRPRGHGAEPLEQGIGFVDPCPSGAGKEVAAWKAPRMGTLIFTHMPMSGR